MQSQGNHRRSASGHPRNKNYVLKKRVAEPVTPDASFFSALSAWMHKRGLDEGELMRRINASGGEFVCFPAWPKRNLVIRLSLALELELHDAQSLLRLSGNRMLNLKILRDAVIAFCLKNHYSVNRTQEFMRKMNLAQM